MTQASRPPELEFAEHGAQLHPGAASDQLSLLHSLADSLPQSLPGVRIAGSAALGELLAPAASLASMASYHLGHPGRAVRAVLFDKTAETNWSLGWHQDRTICVRDRIETPGFGPWTTKAGLLHVEPPFAVIERMVTLRIHLDPVSGDNAPLLVAPGSHRLGKIPAGAVGSAVEACGIVTCLAAAGDVWAYATPILHASRAADSPARRRVLQIDFSTETLPGGLAWLGV